MVCGSLCDSFLLLSWFSVCCRCLCSVVVGRVCLLFISRFCSRLMIFGVLVVVSSFYWGCLCRVW